MKQQRALILFGVIFSATFIATSETKIGERTSKEKCMKMSNIIVKSLVNKSSEPLTSAPRTIPEMMNSEPLLLGISSDQVETLKGVYHINEQSNVSSQYLTYQTCIKNVKNIQFCSYTRDLPDYSIEVFNGISYYNYLFSQPHYQVGINRLLEVCKVCSPNNINNNECATEFTFSMFMSTQSRYDLDYVNKIRIMAETIELNPINFSDSQSVRSALCNYSYVTYMNASIYHRKMYTKAHIRGLIATGKHLIHTAPHIIAKMLKPPYTNINGLTRLIDSVIPAYVSINSSEFVYIHQKILEECGISKEFKNNYILCDYWIGIYANAIRGLVLNSLKLGQELQKDRDPIYKARAYIIRIINNMSQLLLNAGHLSKVNEYLYTNFRLYYLHIFSEIKNIVQYDTLKYGISFYLNIYNKINDENPLKLILYHTFENHTKTNIFQSFLSKVVPYTTDSVYYVNNRMPIKFTLFTHLSSLGDQLVSFLQNLSESVLQILGYDTFLNSKEIPHITIILLNSDEFSFAYALGFRNYLGVFLPSSNTIMTFDLRFNNGILQLDSLHTLAHEFTHALTYAYVRPVYELTTVTEGIAEFITYYILYNAGHNKSAAYWTSIRVLKKHLLSYNFSTYSLPRDMIYLPYNQEERLRNIYYISNLVIAWLFEFNKLEFFQMLNSPSTYFTQKRDWERFTQQFIHRTGTYIEDLTNPNFINSINDILHKRESKIANTKLYNLFKYLRNGHVSLPQEGPKN